MKNFSKSSLILLALLIGVIIWAVSEHNAKETAQNALNAQKIMTTPPAAKIVKQFTDQLKENHTTFDETANKVDGKTVAISKPLLDSIAKKSEVKPSEVTDYKEIATVTEARALKAEQAYDSLKKSLYFRYTDKNVSLAYHPGVQPDTAGTFDFKYDADLNITSFTRRGKFLGLPIGPKSYFTDVYSNDPRTTIKGLRTFEIEQREPFFGLRLQAGGSYSFRSKTYLVGPAAQLYLDRWSVVGTYFYSPTDNRFQPSVGFRYDIFR